MLKCREDSQNIRFSIASNVGAVNETVEKAGKLMRDLGLSSASAPTVVLRELLMNAVVHGNHERADLVVEGGIRRVGMDTFEVEVADEGSGFDYRPIWETPPPDDPRRVKCRGYSLIKNLSERVEFRMGGRHVIAYVREESQTNNQKPEHRNEEVEDHD